MINCRRGGGDADAAASAKDAESCSKVGAFILAFDGARPERAQNGCSYWQNWVRLRPITALLLFLNYPGLTTDWLSLNSVDFLYLSRDVSTFTFLLTKTSFSLFPFIGCSKFRPLMFCLFQIGPLTLLPVTSVETMHNCIFRKVFLSRTALLSGLMHIRGMKIRLQAALPWSGSDGRQRDPSFYVLCHF